jgi:hypothetical protein
MGAFFCGATAKNRGVESSIVFPISNSRYFGYLDAGHALPAAFREAAHET